MSAPIVRVACGPHASGTLLARFSSAPSPSPSPSPFPLPTASLGKENYSHLSTGTKGDAHE
jgi:hypothetical protein